MLTFIAKRFASMLATMLVVSVLVFLLLEVNGESVAVKVLGPYSTEQQRALWLETNGYDRPMALRYLSWLGSVLTGDFGRSLRFKTPVIDIVAARLLNTAILGGIALAIYVAVGLAFGVLAGMREGSTVDRALSVASVVTTSIPEFASAALLSFVFVFWLHLLPGTSGMNAGLDASQLVLPVLVLVIYAFGYVARIVRASMADVMQQAYVRTATLKGIPYRRVVLRHALRNAMIAPFTVIVLQVNWLLSGVIVVEYFFAYKGFGALLLDAALNQDIYLLQACTLVAVFVAVCTQAIADIGYMLLNPRIRFR